MPVSFPFTTSISPPVEPVTGFDAGQFEGFVVGDRGMAVNARQYDRAIREELVQGIVGGKVFTGQSFWSQPRPVSQLSLPGMLGGNSRVRSTTSSLGFGVNEVDALQAAAITLRNVRASMNPG